MTELTEFLFPAPAERRTGAIWTWWERRRLAYNVWVGGAGLFTLGAVSLLSLIPPWPFGPPPLSGMVTGALVFGTLANVFYTAGAVVESLVHAIWGRQLLPVGPALYRIGLTFSVGLALFPTLVMLVAWVVRVVLAVF